VRPEGRGTHAAGFVSINNCCSVPISPSFFNREGLSPIVRGWPLNREGVARTPHDWKTPTFLPFVRPSFHS
jgi:hypothetical protein